MAAGSGNFGWRVHDAGTCVWVLAELTGRCSVFRGLVEERSEMMKASELLMVERVDAWDNVFFQRSVML